MINPLYTGEIIFLLYADKFVWHLSWQQIVVWLILGCNNETESMITIDVPFNYQLCIIDTRCLSLADDSSRRATELAWTTMQLILFSSVYKRRLELKVSRFNK